MVDATTRTERATPKRREEARRHGLVAVSAEVAPLAVLCVVLAVASGGAPLLLDHASVLLREWLAAAGPTAAHDDPVSPLAWRSARALAGVLGPFLLLVSVAGIGAVVAQVGWHPSPALVVPDPRRLGLEAGWKRLVSLDGVASLVKALVKIALVLAVGSHVLVRLGGEALDASAMPIEGVLALAGDGLREVGLVMAAVLVVVAAADHAWVRWRHEQRLKMSRHELREELEQSEGDPRIRIRFRRAHREIAERRMLPEVARADVVLVSPLHVGVALRYRPDESPSPRVLAKGAGELVQRIEDAARAGGVPIVERRALARAIFRDVPIGGAIPQSLYRGVAEILAYLQSQRREAPAGTGGIS
jgi:flagellar biosynthetic protein FlhB